MKTNVPLISSLRKPFRSFLLLVLFGLISFGFMTKAVGFIVVQSQTEVLGSYYRSIGILASGLVATDKGTNPKMAPFGVAF